MGIQIPAFAFVNKIKNVLIFQDYPCLLEGEVLTSQPLSQSSTSSGRSMWELSQPTPSEPQKRKKFEDLGPVAKRGRTETLMEVLQATAVGESLTPVQLLGYIGHRLTYLTDKKLSKFFKSVEKSADIFSRKDVPLELALFLKEKCYITKRHWTELRLHLKPFVELPVYDSMSVLWKNMLPALIKFQNGWRADVYDVVKSTLQRLPPDVLQSLSQAEPQNCGVVAKFISGCDVSGSHKVYRAPSSLGENIDTSHFMVGGIALTQLSLNDESGTVLYNVKNPSCDDNERPILICPGKDTRELNDLTFEAIDQGIQKVHNEPILICYNTNEDNGEFEIEFTVKIELSQLDGKALATALGLQGSFCTMCKVSAADAQNPERIKQLFRIERSIESVQQLYEELVETDEDGNEYIPTKPNDYHIRQGLTQKPLTSQDVAQNFPILHAKLRSLSFFEQIAYRLNSNVPIMGRGKRMNTYQKEKIAVAKKEFINEARKNCQIILDSPRCDGGSSDDGNTARRFFSSENREAVVHLFKGTVHEKAVIRELLQNFSVILRVISSKNLVDVDSFEEFCNQTYILLCQNFPWVSVTTSVHRLLGHSAERIRLNQGFGLGLISEEGLEAVHKLVRRFRELGARKTCLDDNIQDVFTHLFIRSDPIIRSFNRLFVCSKCSEIGHTSRGCPNLKSTVCTKEEDLINGFFPQC